MGNKPDLFEGSALVFLSGSVSGKRRASRALTGSGLAPGRLVELAELTESSEPPDIKLDIIDSSSCEDTNQIINPKDICPTYLDSVKQLKSLHLNKYINSKYLVSLVGRRN